MLGNLLSKAGLKKPLLSLTNVFSTELSTLVTEMRESALSWINFLQAESISLLSRNGDVGWSKINKLSFNYDLYIFDTYRYLCKTKECKYDDYEKYFIDDAHFKISTSYLLAENLKQFIKSIK